jgi:5'(3')-deoxyribonucleotidase
MGVRVYPDVPRVYLDMDGPLADFDLHCLMKGLDPKQAKLHSGTYLNLLPTVGSIEAVKNLTLLKNIEVFVLSKIPSGNPGAATEKHFWLERHFPILANRLILSPDKGCVGSSRDFLIDDHPEWANANKFRGEIITFFTESTQAGQSWPEILNYFSTRLNPH